MNENLLTLLTGILSLSTNKSKLLVSDTTISMSVQQGNKMIKLVYPPGCKEVTEDIGKDELVRRLKVNDQRLVQLDYGC